MGVKGHCRPGRGPGGAAPGHLETVTSLPPSDRLFLPLKTPTRSGPARRASASGLPPERSAAGPVVPVLSFSVLGVGVGVAHGAEA